MSKPALVILAAGIGSRYGGNKQTDAFGPDGESLMGYSIYDGIQAGFKKIVLVVREEMQSDLEVYFGSRIPAEIELSFVLQELKSFVPESHFHHRTKPWGTGHALLCCKPVVKEPFALINADDFYGRDAFIHLYNFLRKECNDLAIVPFALEDVMSAHGPVSRGVLKMNDDGCLQSIHEYTGLYKSGNKILSAQAENLSFNLQDLCSMNCWALGPEIFTTAEFMFRNFLISSINQPETEFYLPAVIEQLILEGNARVQVLSKGNNWFGVTYPQDKTEVIVRLNQLIEAGHYPKQLWVNSVK